MRFIAACKWFLSKSQAVSTWQSFSARKASVLLGPCMPQPTTPSVIRSEGAVAPPRPSALAGMSVGAARAAPVRARKWRRLIPESFEECFMQLLTPEPQAEFENKIAPSPISIGPLHWECIGQMPNFPNLTLVQKHFNDVESYFHSGIFYKSQ